MDKNIEFIPVISGNNNGRAKEINAALDEYGFFFYPIDDKLKIIVSSIFELSKKFFSLPENSKFVCGKASGNDTGRVSGYYSSFEYENDTKYRGDIKEAFQLLKNPFGEEDSWPHYFWPTEFPEMEGMLNSFYDELCQLSAEILTLIESSISISDHELVQMHSQKKHFLRLLRYPSPNKEQIKNKRYWCGEHFDYGTLTLLFQTQTAGIQVKHKDYWIDASYLDGHVLVNSGSVLREISGGRFKAAFHRVPFPSDVDKSTLYDRYSIAFFAHPNYNSKIRNLTINDDHYILSKDFLRSCMMISKKNNSGYKP